MAKAPAFQFYIKDWSGDPQLRMCAHSTKGVWVDMLCLMWLAPVRGELTGTWDQIQRSVCAKDEDFKRFVADNNALNFCDISVTGEVVTVRNRRMWREDHEREGNRRRQKKYRDNGGGDPSKWTAIRIRILDIDENMCAYCGRKADTVDHIIPRTMGGGEEDENLVACCKRCNQQKNNRTPEDANMEFWQGFKRINSVYNAKITPLSSTATASAKKEKVIKEKISFEENQFKNIPADLIEKWKSIAPAISVNNEIAKAEAWVMSNPKLKRSNWSRFLTNWMIRAQDNTRRDNATTTTNTNQHRQYTKPSTGYRGQRQPAELPADVQADIDAINRLQAKKTASGTGTENAG